MKFTIGIPAYKSSYLKECIDSILSQTYSDFEIVVVNDNSPEDIDSIIKTYNSPLIRYYKNDVNHGAVNVVDNWNKCLSYARGEFFILMGDDDKMCPNYLEEFVNLIAKYPDCGVYHCRTILINERSETIGLTEPRPEHESVFDSILQRMRNNRIFFISDYVYRTEPLKQRGGFYKLPLAWASDDISSYLAAEPFGTAHTNVPVFMYRQNAQTISSTGNVFMKMQAILEEEKWLTEFLKKTPSNPQDILLRTTIQRELKKFIQKKKIRTIYSADHSTTMSLFFAWFQKRAKYRFSMQELIYAMLMRFKEKRKSQYA